MHATCVTHACLSQHKLPDLQSSETFPVIAPPRTSVTYNVIVVGGNFNLPWVANLLLTFDTGELKRACIQRCYCHRPGFTANVTGSAGDALNTTCTGIYTGVSVTGTTVTISTPQVLTASTPQTPVSPVPPSSTVLAAAFASPSSLNNTSACAKYLVSNTTSASNFSGTTSYGQVGTALGGGTTNGCVMLMF